MVGKGARKVPSPGRANTPRGIPDRQIFSMKVVDSTGIEYEMALIVDFRRVERLARRLFKSADGRVELLEGALIGTMKRTGQVVPVNRESVLRRRVRDGVTEEVPQGGGGE